jgi:hypothetical protein
MVCSTQNWTTIYPIDLRPQSPLLAMSHLWSSAATSMRPKHFGSIHSLLLPSRGLCAPAVFSTSASQSSIFEWKIVAITRPSAGKSSVAYDGANLHSCDIVQLSSYGDLRTWTLGTTVYVACRGSDGLEVVASTTLRFSSLPGFRSPFFHETQSGEDDPVKANLMEM